MPISQTPVLEVLPSVRRWERIRLPLAMGAVVVLLFAVGVLVYCVIRHDRLLTDLADARAALAEGSISGWARFDTLLGAHGGLTSDEPDVAALAVYGAVMRSVLLGRPDAAAARGAVVELSGKGEIACAARSWALLLDDHVSLEATTTAARAFPASAPIRHAHAMALWQGGSRREALAEIGAVRQAEPGWVPAILTQADMLRRAGDHRAALATIRLLSEAEYPERGLIAAACMLDEAEARATVPAELGRSFEPAEATKAPRFVSQARLIQGRYKRLSGDAAGAVGLLRQAAALDRRDMDAIVELTRALIGSGDARGAALATGAHAVPAVLVERTLALALLHRTRDAEATLERIPSSDLPPARGAILRSLLAWQRQDLPEAERQAALAVDAGDAGAVVRRGEALLALGRRGAALRALRDSDLACARAFRLWIEGRWREAAAAFDDARQSEPVCVARLLGRNGFGLRPPAEVAAELSRSIAQWPDAEDRLLLARVRHHSGGDGASEIAAVLEAGADSIVALELAADEYAELGLAPHARSVVEKMKSLYEADPRSSALEIRVSRMLGDVAAAMQLSDAALAAAPDSRELQRERSITLVFVERIAEHIAESDRVSDIGLRPDRHFIDFVRARVRVLETARGFPAADQQMVRAIHYASRNLSYSDEVRVRSLAALLHARRGGRRELKAAESLLRPLLRNEIKSVDLHLAQAMIHWGHGRLVQLGAHLQRALALDPMLPGAYDLLDEADLLDEQSRRTYERLFPGRPLAR